MIVTVIQHYESFLGIKTLNSDARRFIVRSFNFHWLFTTLIWLTNTFLILYALKYVNSFELGILITSQLLVQVIIDYPTGVLGDWIGHRWVLIFGAIFYSLAYFMLFIAPLTLVSTTQEFLIPGEGIISKEITISGPVTKMILYLAFILLALASSQESGAFDSWFQNNYKAFAPEDNDRRIFTELIAKKEVILYIITALTFTLSGFLIIMFQGEQFVFLLQSILFLITPLMIIKVIRNHPAIQIDGEKLEFSNYLTLMKEGFLSIKNNRVLLLFIIGTAIFASAGAVWSNLMLFPIYEGYSQSPDRLGLLRAFIYCISALSLFLFGTLARKIQRTKPWMLIFALFQSPMFFGVTYLILRIFPLTYWDYSMRWGGPAWMAYPFEWNKFFIVIVAFTMAILPYIFFQILSVRVYLDIIPDKNRNSVYSLIPTIFALLTIVTVYMGGNIIQSLMRSTQKLGTIIQTDITAVYQTVLLFLLVIGFIGCIITIYAIYLYKPTDRPDKPLLPPIIVPPNRLFTSLQVMIPFPIPSPYEVKHTAKDYFYYWPLVGTALADGEITSDEKKLLVSILTNLKEYTKILERASEDNIITANEKNALSAAREKMWKDAHKVAIETDRISDDEHKILTKLLDVIRSLESEEKQLERNE